MEGEIAAGFNSLRDAIQDGTKQTVKQLERAVEINTRTEIAKEIANLNAIEPIIQVQADNLIQEKKRAVESASRVVLKYDRVEKELEESYKQDIRCFIYRRIFEANPLVKRVSDYLYPYFRGDNQG